METKESKIYDLILRIDDFYLTNNDQLEGFIFHEEFLGCFIFVQLNGLGIKSLKDNTRFKISIEGNVINLTSILDEKDEVDEKYDFYSLPYANEEFLVLANTNDDYPKLDIQTIGFEDFSTTGIINKKVASSLNKNKLHINKVLDYILKCKRLRNNNKIIINVSDFIQTINETVPKKDSFSLFRGHYNHKYLPIPSLIRNTKYLENENY